MTLNEFLSHPIFIGSIVYTDEDSIRETINEYLYNFYVYNFLDTDDLEFPANDEVIADFCLVYGICLAKKKKKPKLTAYLLEDWLIEHFQWFTDDADLKLFKHTEIQPFIDAINENIEKNADDIYIADTDVISTEQLVTFVKEIVSLP